MRKKQSLLEDSLMQMLISAITDTLARLAGLKTAGFYKEALAEIDQDLEELLGLKADLARRLSNDRLIEMLTVNEVLDVGRLHFVAELFREEGEILERQGNIVEGRARRIRALELLVETGFAAREGFPEVPARIDELFQELLNFLPEDTLFTLFDYFEQQGAFAKALAAIDRMLVVTHQNPEIVYEKREFYRRLLSKPDSELEAGGLKRIDVIRQST